MRKADPFRPVHAGKSEPGDVPGFPFNDTCGNRVHHAAYWRDGDSRICVFAGRGFRNTSDYKKYLITMVITALVSEIPYDLAIRGKIWDFSSQNAMITMCICLVMLKCLDLFKETSGFTGGMLKVLILIAAIVWVSIFRQSMDFVWCCLCLCSMCLSQKCAENSAGCIISLMYVTGPIAFYGIWCYTGERKNRINKYVYYAFYPLHLLVLGVIANYIL